MGRCPMTQRRPRRPPAGRDEAEAAYFTLLRAREELDRLRRYEDALRDEERRLARFEGEGEALAERIHRTLRRPLRHTDELLSEALRARRAVVADELSDLPDRIVAAEAFVADCEREHDELRRR